MADKTVVYMETYRLGIGTETVTLSNSDGKAMFSDGDGGGSGVTPDTMNAKLEAVEARVDTKFAELRGDLGRLPTTGTILATAIALVAIVIAVIAFGGDSFGAGAQLSERRVEQIQADAKQDAAIIALKKNGDEINGKLDALLARDRDQKSLH